MNPSIVSKLEQLSTRHEEISGLLAEPAVIGEQERFRALAVEYAQLEPVARYFEVYRKMQQDEEAAREMAKDADPELRTLAEDELLALESRRTELEKELQRLLLPSDPHDNSSIFL